MFTYMKANTFFFFKYVCYIIRSISYTDIEASIWPKNLIISYISINPLPPLQCNASRSLEVTEQSIEILPKGKVAQ